MKRFLLILIIFSLPALVNAELYTWVDGNGIKHFTNKKPASMENVKTIPEILSRIEPYDRPRKKTIYADIPFIRSLNDRYYTTSPTFSSGYSQYSRIKAENQLLSETKERNEELYWRGSSSKYWRGYYSDYPTKAYRYMRDWVNDRSEGLNNDPSTYFSRQRQGYKYYGWW